MPARPDVDGDHWLRVIDSVWQQTQQHWLDEMASHFDRTYWAPLVDESRAYLRALGECMELMSTADRDTEF